MRLVLLGQRVLQDQQDQQAQQAQQAQKVQLGLKVLLEQLLMVEQLHKGCL